MMFKKNVNMYYIRFYINSNNIQNNQRKDNLKGLNQKIKNYSRIIIIGCLNNLNRIYRRSMFTKGNGILKKSGEIFSNVPIKTTGDDITNITVNTANNFKFRLDASNHRVKAQNLAYFTKIFKNKIPYQNIR